MTPDELHRPSRWNYEQHGCRCAGCITAHRDGMRAWRERREAAKADAAGGRWREPRLRGISHRRRVEIEQAIARTGSLAAAMHECEVSYETVHTLMEWMAA